MKWKDSDIKKYAIGSLTVGLIMAVASGIRILQKPLWNHETLILLVGAWLVLSGLLALRVGFRQHIHVFLFSALGGVLACLGFPPLPFLPLIFFAFIPLLWLENEHYHGRLSKRWLLYGSFNFFIIWNIGTTFWITNTAFLPGIVGMLINTGLMVLVVGWISWIHKRAKIDWYFGSLFIAGWLTFEFFHLRWELSWPWLHLGNALASWPAAAQWYEYTGTLGGTLWILMLNYLFFQLLRKHGLTRSLVRFSIIGKWLFWLIVPMVWSLIVYFTTSPAGSDLHAVVINPNIEPHFEKFTQDEESRWAVYSALVEKALETNPDLIVLPETIFDGINLDNIDLNPSLTRLNQLLEQHEGESRLLMGIAAYRVFRGKPIDRSSVRTSTDPTGQTFQWEAYNSAIMLGLDTIPVYHKQKLVPGAEIFPYRRLLFFLNPIIDQLGGSVHGYGRIGSQDVFDFGHGKIAPVICYESVYGEYTRKYIAQGANVIGIVTNDGWWGNTAGHRQHYEFAALRAIEYRRSVLRSANMGMSGAFDQLGRPVVSPNDYDEAAVIPVTVQLNDRLTFYAIWGDFLGRFSIFMMLFFSLKAFVASVVRK